MNLFRKIKLSIQLNAAIRKADEEHHKTGRRYYVLPYVAERHRPHLIIMDRQNFRKLKQKRYIRSEATISAAIDECFYATPYSNGTGKIHPADLKTKRIRYFQWAEEILRGSKNK